MRDVLRWQPGPPGHMDLLSPCHLPLPLGTNDVGIGHSSHPGRFLPWHLRIHLQSWRVGSKVTQEAGATVHGAWAIDVRDGGYGAAGAGADGDLC